MSSVSKDKNHLYDNIDEDINGGGDDFTEDDLKNDEKKDD